MGCGASKPTAAGDSKAMELAAFKGVLDSLGISEVRACARAARPGSASACSPGGCAREQRR